MDIGLYSAQTDSTFARVLLPVSYGFTLYVSLSLAHSREPLETQPTHHSGHPSCNMKLRDAWRAGRLNEDCEDAINDRQATNERLSGVRTHGTDRRKKEARRPSASAADDP